MQTFRRKRDREQRDLEETMIEKDFDVPFVAALALREKQIQQNYRPIIAVHKWFARRPGTLFRSLLLSEFGEGALGDIYFKTNCLKGVRVTDPFMGGGTPLFEANRLGCDVIGYDINPMAYWIVRQEIENLDLIAYREAADTLTAWLENKVGALYRTQCLHCDASNTNVKYFLWVKTQSCCKCGNTVDLFPGYLLAQDRRHPQNVFVCQTCGALTETRDRKNPGNCQACSVPLARQGPARRNRCACPHCDTINTYPETTSGPLSHRMFAIEYHCRKCRPQHRGRFFKKPDDNDLSKYAEAETIFSQMESLFIPDEKIPRGDETDRLHRWGYQRYREMFNARQLLGLELSCRAIARVPDERVRNALATNLSDLLRYQNMLCRYDTMALKSLDIFSVHGFPVGLVQCESNFLGLANRHKGTNIGSGGWLNIIEKFAKAKAYCTHPFEVMYQGKKRVQMAVAGEWIGDRRNGVHGPERRKVTLHCESATQAHLAPASLDAVFTDPPYFGNVQYAELMDFCYVWLRRLVGKSVAAFQAESTRNADELTGNVTMDRGLNHFTAGLADVFCRMTDALKPGAPFAFTYHHNTLEAYYPITVAILDAGLTCSASLPCPAEMGGSIHINKTGSSIIDTIFVCRVTGTIPRRWIVVTPGEIAQLVREDIEHLCAGEVCPTQGDMRCIIFGHMVRLAVWQLRHTWNQSLSVEEKLAMVAKQLQKNRGFQAIEQCLGNDLLQAPRLQHAIAREHEALYGTRDDDISF
jgi:adenine-specific DNA methylase